MSLNETAACQFGYSSELPCPGNPISVSQSPGLQVGCHTLAILCEGDEYPNSRPHVCTTSALSSEPPPQPLQSCTLASYVFSILNQE